MVYLAFYAAMAVYLPFLNVYFHSLGLDGWQIGILSALLPAMSFVVTPLVTVLADRRRHRVLALVICLVGSSITVTLLAGPSTFVGLLPVMALFTLFYSPIVALADTTIVRMAVSHRLNYGGMRLWGSFGFAVAAAVAGAIWQHFGYRAMFAATGALLLVNAAFGFTLEEGTREEQRAEASWRDIGRDRLLVGLLITTFITASAVGIDSTFAGIYLTGLGGSGTQVGLLYGLAAICELPAMRYSGGIAARIGPARALVLAYGLFLLTYVGYAAAGAPVVLLLLSVLRGSAYGLFYVGTIRLLNERAPSQWSATVQGIMNATAYGLGQLISRPLAGHIYDVSGGKALYLFCAALVGVAALGMGGLAGRADGRVPVERPTSERVAE